MNGRCLRAEIERERKTARKLFRVSGLSCFQVLITLRVVSPIAEKQAGVVLPVALAGHESSPIYQSVCPNLDNVILNHL